LSSSKKDPKIISIYGIVIDNPSFPKQRRKLPPEPAIYLLIRIVKQIPVFFIV